MSKLDKFNKKAHRHFDQNSVDFIQLNDGTKVTGSNNVAVVRVERHFTGYQVVHLLVPLEGIDTNEELSKRAVKIAQNTPNEYYFSVDSVDVVKYVAQPEKAEPEEVNKKFDNAIELDIWDEIELP